MPEIFFFLEENRDTKFFYAELKRYKIKVLNIKFFSFSPPLTKYKNKKIERKRKKIYEMNDRYAAGSAATFEYKRERFVFFLK